jgi:type II secretion system protein J
MRNYAAFTLLELLVASAIFAVLAGALYSVFSGALRLRERAYATIERELPASAALSIMRRDLEGIMVTSGTQTVALAGQMLGTPNLSGGSNQDTLQFFTTSGTVDERSPDPWGDVQKVNYLLEGTEMPDGAPGLGLVREVTRNILAPNVPEPDRQWLLTGVQSLKIEYLDNQAWMDTWDSEANAKKPPVAVKVRIGLLPTVEDDPEPEPVELVCRIASRDANTTETQGGSQ